MIIKLPVIVTTIMMKIMMKKNSFKEIVTGIPDEIQY